VRVTHTVVVHSAANALQYSASKRDATEIAGSIINYYRRKRRAKQTWLLNLNRRARDLPNITVSPFHRESRHLVGSLRSTRTRTRKVPAATGTGRFPEPCVF
jgi:hypothetical protein